MNMPNSAPQTEAMIFTITPELAKQWLELNMEGNRILRRKTVDQYAMHMRNNEWPLTGQPIIFDDEQLIDGQHRLHACVKAGVSFRSLVVRNVDANAFQYLDRGLKRSIADALKFRSHTNVTRLASAVRLVLFCENKFSALSEVERKLTQQQIIDEIESNIDVYRLASSIGYRAKENGFLEGAGAAMYVLLVKQFGQLIANEFMMPAIEGTNLQKNDPRLSLRRFTTKERPDGSEQLSAWIKTFNAWASGKSLQKIFAWKSGQAFPTLNKMKENTNVIR
jgi:hypothetical protein